MDPNRRIEFHNLLGTILGDPEAVYFQPGEGRELKRPCIIYNLSDVSIQYADNTSYSGKMAYDVTYIDHDPDSVIPFELLRLPYARFDRRFATSGLNHSVCVIYY